MKKTKIPPHRRAGIAIIAVSFLVWGITFFAMADNKTSGSVFLDSDQDGLTDQQEKLIGTDPHNPDTDNDGYFDGEEEKSCYNPMKPAPGDKLTADQCAAMQKILADPDHAQPLNLTLSSGTSTNSQNTNISQTSQNTPTDLNSTATDPLPGGADSSLSSPSDNSLAPQTFTDLSSDPNNPNLTNEMVGQLLQLTNQAISPK
ncbi:MAG: thrombospondin type 3 repeat-containing protein [Candidatus Moranbacteria bacterium]|nr:thrombospondin type 3 repeat-containing protein [Candidatus Moranbacteria bacterium]